MAERTATHILTISRGVLSKALDLPDLQASFLKDVMLAAPTTHFVPTAQAILYRAAGFEVVWPQFLALVAIGAAFFRVALRRFRTTIGQIA